MLMEQLVDYLDLSGLLAKESTAAHITATFPRYALFSSNSNPTHSPINEDTFIKFNEASSPT